MITERKENGKIEVLSDGTIQVRTDTIIERDNVEIARTYHRVVLSPLDDVSNQSEEVQRIAALVRTPERIARAEQRKIEDSL